MKWILIFLAIGLTASEKLDRTYLPPPGAQFAGGNPDDIQVPLEPPNLSQPENIQTGLNLNGLQDLGPNGQPTQGPVTTTSYAFTQTTTYPSIESYETTALPINPVTGLPVQNLVSVQYQQGDQNVPGYDQNNNEFAPGYVQVQPELVSQGLDSNGQPINIGGSTYNQAANQPLNQYSNQQRVVIPGNKKQSPGEAGQDNNGIYSQYPNGQLNNEISNQYLNQNNIPGANIQSFISESLPSGANQGTTQYPNGQITSTQNQQTNSNSSPQDQYIEIGHKGPHIGEFSQGTYSGPPINIQDTSNPQIGQGYQNQGQVGQDSIQVQQPIDQDQNILQPRQDYNGVQSTTASPGFVSSTSAYSSDGPVNRPERPQAAGDRNAVILSYENVRSPNGYSYSYDTSNGIHADETGTVDDGTKAQGGYSYIGDDGKVYSVRYTADENGFRPVGDHIPTAPPIPEAIQKVIEQAARDKAAGIIDDGSYDEAKYGYKDYKVPVHNRRLQPKDRNKIQDQYDETQDTIRPISGINDEDYDEKISQGINDNIPSIGINGQPINKRPIERPSDKIIGKNGKFDINKQNQVKQDIADRPTIENLPFSDTEAINNVDNNEFSSKHLGTLERKPISNSGVKGIKAQYPESSVKNTDETGNHPDYEPSTVPQFDNDKTQSLNEDNRNVYSPDKTIGTSSDSSPISSGQQTSKQRLTGSRRPDLYDNKYIQDNGPQSSPIYKQDGNKYTGEQKDISTSPIYRQNNVNAQIPSQVDNQQIDENGYYYDRPRGELGQTQFPSRFKGQEVFSTVKPISQKKGTSIRPFQTPEVYNQRGNKPSRKQNMGQQYTVRQPFMTSRVTTPNGNIYKDYDDGEDYNSDQDIDDEDINTYERPNKETNIGSRRPSKPIQTTSIPQDAAYGQRMRVRQKGTVAPSQLDSYTTATPGYTYEATTPLPTQSSRFGSTEAPKESSKQDQRRPATSRRPGTSTAVGRPVSSSKPAIEKSSDTRPVLEYPSTTVAPGYSPNNVQPGYDSRGPYTQTGYSQNYPTYTTTSNTVLPTTPGYQTSSGIYVPSSTQETYQQSPVDMYQTRQQYGPVRTDYVATGVPQKSTPESYVSGTYPTSAPGYYQNSYQQGPIDSIGSTVRPSMTNIPGTFIPSGPGSTAPQFSPTGSYQNSYQYPLPTPSYTTTTASMPQTSTGTPGSYYSQPSPTSYEYGPAGPNYSTTSFLSTIGTTGRPLIPSTTPGRPYEYTATQGPNYSSTQPTYGQGLVDGYGRPIVSGEPNDQTNGQALNQYPGTQFIGGNNLIGPTGTTLDLNSLPSGDASKDSLKPMYDEQSFNYPGYYGQPQVIGEDFSGPNQPQRFDPQTGYHY